MADKSLSFMILKISMKAGGDDNFSFDTKPYPPTFMPEVYRVRRTGKRRVLLAPITFIHEDRITKFECDIEGETATGAVEFKVPDVYRGRAEFKAKKDYDGRWLIHEFRLPAGSIHIEQAESGFWVEVE